MYDTLYGQLRSNKTNRKEDVSFDKNQKAVSIAQIMISRARMLGSISTLSILPKFLYFKPHYHLQTM